METVFGLFDVSGVPQGYFFESVHSKIPPDAVIISEEDYQAYVQEQGKWLRDLVTGQRVPAPPPPPPTRDVLLVGIRAERDRRLAACDWTVLPDSALTPEKRAVWAVYRQILRDFPQSCDPLNPVWPISI